MSTGAWIMLALGAGLNYGLLAYFISIAVKKGMERTAKNGGRTKDEESRPPTEESAVERCY